MPGKDDLIKAGLVHDLPTVIAPASESVELRTSLADLCVSVVLQSDRPRSVHQQRVKQSTSSNDPQGVKAQREHPQLYFE
jgi:hypothetical protein